MIALDTNILARFFIEDSQDKESIKQQKIAHQVLLNACYVPVTVVLEFFWVMDKGYKLTQAQICQVVTKLCSLSRITVESDNQVLIALNLYMQGMDFADALHLVQSKHCDSFYTFDKKLDKKASALYSHTPVIIPQSSQ